MRTIGTQPLSPDQTWNALALFAELCRQTGITQLRVEYGWGCRAPTSDVPSVVGTEALATWVQQAIAQNYYTLGEDNLHLHATTPAMEFLLCHEGDVHFKTDNALLLAAMRTQWQTFGWSVWGG